ncbi:hypothetical protein Tco_0541426 [Tanacetum coccineum]
MENPVLNVGCEGPLKGGFCSFCASRNENSSAIGNSGSSTITVVNMDLFAFINHADPTKVQIGERDVTEGEIPLLQLTRGRVVLLAADDEAQAIVADKLKRIRKKRKAADGAGGSGLPPKKLRKDHGVSGNVGASTGGKSVSALQSLLEGSTLAVEVGVTVATIVPFVTSSVTPILEREGPADSISKTSLRMQHPAERFVISSDSSHDFNANDADDEVTSIVRSSVHKTEKYRGSNSGDDGNTGDGGKTVSGAIGACGDGIGDSLLVALYACMTFIYGSSWKSEMASEAKRSLDISSEGSEEVFPDEAGE